jgi:hypothetical protein
VINFNMEHLLDPCGIVMRARKGRNQIIGGPPHALRHGRRDAARELTAPNAVQEEEWRIGNCSRSAGERIVGTLRQRQVGE